MFNHANLNFEFEELQTRSINDLRYYQVGNELYPSVTSILSVLSKDRIRAWKDSIGHYVANFESRRAANRGTNFHKICEDYLCNKDISIHRKNVLAFGLFTLVKKEIERIDNIYGLEKTLCSHNLKIAGRVDCVAEFDNIVSIIDFKSSNKAKSPEILENHFLRETAYSVMWVELAKNPIEQIVTIVASENGESQIAIEKPVFFIEKLKETIELFKQSEIMSEKIPRGISNEGVTHDSV